MALGTWLFLASGLVFFCVASDKACKLVFRNNGEVPIRVFWVPHGAVRGVQIDTLQQWELVASATSSADLRLTDALEWSEESGLGVPKGARLNWAQTPGGVTSDPEGLRTLLRDASAGERPTRIMFLLDDAGPRPVGIAAPGEGLGQNSVSGHRFLLEAVGDVATSTTVQVWRSGTINVALVSKKLVVGGDALKVEPEDPERARRLKAEAEEVRADCNEVFANYDSDRAHFCNPRHDNRVYITSRLEISNPASQQRRAQKKADNDQLTREQPGRFRNFTHRGFEPVPAPAELLAELQRFHQDERLRLSVPENHDFENAALSGSQSDTWLLQLPPRLKQKVEDTARPVLAKWAGLQTEDLIPTATYGIRLYHNGSVLHWHVDREKTHAISAIIEVAHLPIGTPDDVATQATPWPLQILDHAGQLHHVPDKVGQMILYESATCAHARPEPFHGREFANIFVHFAPKGWPEAYRAGKTHQEL